MTEQTEREVLEALWLTTQVPPFYERICEGNCPICQWEAKRLRFRAMLDCGAYLDAAMMLVPEGMAIDRLSIWPGQAAGCSLWGTRNVNGERWHHIDDGRFEGEGETPALALCAAITKAKDTAP